MEFIKNVVPCWIICIRFLVFGVFVRVGTRYVVWCCEWCLCLIVYGHDPC